MIFLSTAFLHFSEENNEMPTKGQLISKCLLVSSISSNCISQKIAWLKSWALQLAFLTFSFSDIAGVKHSSDSLCAFQSLQPN